MLLTFIIFYMPLLFFSLFLYIHIYIFSTSGKNIDPKIHIKIPSRWKSHRKQRRNKWRRKKKRGRETITIHSFHSLQLFDRTNDIIIYFYWMTLTLSNFPNDFWRLRTRKSLYKYSNFFFSVLFVSFILSLSREKIIISEAIA